jgi:hypothetical protein
MPNGQGTQQVPQHRGGRVLGSKNRPKPPAPQDPQEARRTASAQRAQAAARLNILLATCTDPKECRRLAVEIRMLTAQPRPRGAQADSQEGRRLAAQDAVLQDRREKAAAALYQYRQKRNDALPIPIEAPAPHPGSPPPAPAAQPCPGSERAAKGTSVSTPTPTVPPSLQRPVASPVPAGNGADAARVRVGRHS